MNPPPEPAQAIKPPSSRGRRIKRFLLAAALLMVGMAACFFSLLWSWVAKPPPMPRDAETLAITHLDLDQRGGRTWLGKCWTEEREGLQTLYLTGSPFEIGYANGRLTSGVMHQQENALLDLIHHYVPYTALQYVLKFYVTYRNRGLPGFVSADHQMELLGISRGCPDAHPEIGPFYHRLLNYHAAHDISYMMLDNPLVSGCTSFGAWGSFTPGAHLICGRNFDWEAAEVFDVHRQLVLCEPDRGIAFISLSWGGMVGCVSGMNRAGVSVTLNGAPTGVPKGIGTPSALVAREILQYAHDLGEAEAILQKSQLFISELFLIGSRKDGRFVVVEAKPDQAAVRKSDGEFIVCANHFLSDEMKMDEKNHAYLREGTSQARYDRMLELLNEKRGALGPSEAADVLRDRKLTGGAFPGNGHRSTLNPLIATHSVVIDLTEGIFWAATTPHQLGAFVGFDINDFERRLPERSIPPDPILASGEYQQYLDSVKELKGAELRLKKGDAQGAIDRADKAELLNPGHFGAVQMRGRALLALNRKKEAREALELAMERKPAFPKEAEEIKKLLEETSSR